jgi:hypothetical protein
MNFFLLYVSLPALLFGIMAKTPFAELNNPPFLIATTLGTATAFVLALVAGRLVGRLSFRVRIDVAHGAVPAAVGGHRDPDNIAAAGAECVRDCTATRHLVRTRIGRRADRNVRARHHAYQRDVVHPDPVGWCFRKT